MAPGAKSLCATKYFMRQPTTASGFWETKQRVELFVMLKLRGGQLGRIKHLLTGFEAQSGLFGSTWSIGIPYYPIMLNNIAFLLQYHGNTRYKKEKKLVLRVNVTPRLLLVAEAKIPTTLCLHILPPPAIYSPPSVNTRSWELGNSEGQECCYVWHGPD